MPSTTELIKELREKTGAGIMECKRAVDDALGDMAKAEQLIKERGLAMAEKKAGRSGQVLTDGVHDGSFQTSSAWPVADGTTSLHCGNIRLP